MNRTTLKLARQKAHDFLLAVSILEDENNHLDNITHSMRDVSPKNRGEVKRASMELTRALAKMRSPK
jgi:hypothetical protein